MTSLPVFDEFSGLDTWSVAGMMRSEREGLRYLRKVKGDWDEIEKLGVDGEPDFLIDGEYYEVKKGEGISFTVRQLEDFPKYNPILILVRDEMKIIRFSEFLKGLLQRVEAKEGED